MKMKILFKLFLFNLFIYNKTITILKQKINIVQ